MTERENALFSTARLVFLSKSNKEIVKDHKEYRCLAVQPTFIRILESIVYDNIDTNMITESQYAEQAGFTRNKSTKNHLMNLWNTIQKCKTKKQRLYVASLDIKGAYDGINH